MDLFDQIVHALGQLGVWAQVHPGLDRGGVCFTWRAQRHCVVYVRQRSTKVLAHEAVHVLQYLYKLEGDSSLIGMNPLQFNPSLRGNMQVLSQMWRLLRTSTFYTQKDWEVEVPAFALQEDPQRVLFLLKAAIAAGLKL